VYEPAGVLRTVPCGRRRDAREPSNGSELIDKAAVASVRCDSAARWNALHGPLDGKVKLALIDVSNVVL
jgi:hypothetical protein